MDWKELLTGRLAQLVARYASVGLVALGTKLVVTVDAAQAESAAQLVGTFVAAGALALYDHWAHGRQKKD